MLQGRYLPEGFGLVPRAVIWGALCVCITVAFTIFLPVHRSCWPHWGWNWAPARWPGRLGDTSWQQPFAVSLTMNTMFAPVLMVAHKIGDLHLAAYGGRPGMSRT